MTFLSQSSDRVYSCAHADNSSWFSLLTVVISLGASKTNTSFASKKSKNKGDWSLLKSVDSQQPVLSCWQVFV